MEALAGVGFVLQRGDGVKNVREEIVDEVIEVLAAKMSSGQLKMLKPDITAAINRVLDRQRAALTV